MPLTVIHAKTNNIPAWTQSDLDLAIAAGQFPPGTTIADITLSTDWNDDHNISGTPDSTYVELTDDKVLSDQEENTTFLNTSAASLIDIDFSSITPIKAFDFMVTNTNGINIVNPGTILLAGQSVSGDVSSTTLGSTARVTKINSTTLVMQTHGTWEYP